jgi:hypothetical protein
MKRYTLYVDIEKTDYETDKCSRPLEQAVILAESDDINELRKLTDSIDDEIVSPIIETPRVLFDLYTYIDETVDEDSEVVEEGCAISFAPLKDAKAALKKCQRIIKKKLAEED